jgi:hypothetical protein
MPCSTWIRSMAGGIRQAELPAGAPVGDHVGQGAQPDSAFDGAAALGQ